MNIYWSHQEQKIIPSLNSQTAVTRFEFIVRDMLPVTLRVCNWQAVQNVPYVVTALDANKVIKFGAKALTTYATDANFLFSQATWTTAGTGESTTYSANIPLNTSELISALGTSAYLDCKAEFTVYDTVEATNELSTQFTIRIYPDVVTGSEGVPSCEYPVIQQTVDANGAQIVRIVDANAVLTGVFKNGAPYVFIQSTGLWYPMTGTVVDGIPIPAFGAGEQF